jgi:hypothetical protein
MCIALLDDTGEPGVRRLVAENKGAAFFSIGAVVFPDLADADACDAQINLLRQDLGMNKDEEFKFSKSSDSRRRKFLAAIAQFPFLYAMTTIDKYRLQGKGNSWNKKSFMFWEATRRTLDVVLPHLLDARVFVDNSSSW